MRNQQFGKGIFHSWQMLERLGVKKLPENGMTPRLVDGVRVWVTPLVNNDRRAPNGRILHPKTHRVMCECTICHADMSAGRLWQHMEQMHQEVL